jgi:hypothetical protein
MDYDRFLSIVAREAGVDAAVAERATRDVVVTLAHRIQRGPLAEVTRHAPEPTRRWFSPKYPRETFDCRGVRTPGRHRAGRRHQFGGAAGPCGDSSFVDVDAALSWIDLHSGASPGSSGRKLSQRLKALDKRALQDRNGQRAKVGRRDVAQALSSAITSALPPYRVRIDGHVVSTSILCQAHWQNLGIPLVPTHDRLNLSRSATRISTEVDDVAATHAVRRVAESIALHVRLTRRGDGCPGR